ncbi:MAG: acylneuraminate cytidylyltransferase family protein [Algibacter sp.]
MRNKTIVIIPARKGSKRLPEKNTKLLSGLPLIVHSILYAKKHAFIDQIYVTTNDLKVKKIAIQYGAKVIDRPDSLSGDLEPTVTALNHVLEVIELEVENVILLQVTNPLRPLNMLKDAFEIFNNKKLESLFTVTKNNHKLGEIVDSTFKPYNYKIGQRSQDLEPLFYENGLLYIAKAYLIKKEIIISEKAFPLLINHPFSKVDIDNIDDFEYAEYLINKNSL